MVQVKHLLDNAKTWYKDVLNELSQIKDLEEFRTAFVDCVHWVQDNDMFPDLLEDVPKIPMLALFPTGDGYELRRESPNAFQYITHGRSLSLEARIINTDGQRVLFVPLYGQWKDCQIATIADFLEKFIHAPNRKLCGNQDSSVMKLSAVRLHPVEALGGMLAVDRSPNPQIIAALSGTPDPQVQTVTSNQVLQDQQITAVIEARNKAIQEDMSSWSPARNFKS